MIAIPILNRDEMTHLPPRLTLDAVVTSAIELAAENLLSSELRTWYLTLAGEAEKQGFKPILMSWPDESTTVFLLDKRSATVPKSWAWTAYLAARLVCEEIEGGAHSAWH